MRIKNRSEGYVRRNKTLLACVTRWQKWANPPGRFTEWTSQTLEFTVKPVYKGHPREMARWLLYRGWLLYTGQLCRKYKATENFGKLSGDRNIQGDRYTQGRYIKVWLYLQKHLASIFVLFFFFLAAFAAGIDENNKHSNFEWRGQGEGCCGRGVSQQFCRRL